ncbi:MAG: hypothetical protein VX265_17830 [Myxococcota bacterium]|nr:hypothetical protein [Myxococcota bacterium]
MADRHLQTSLLAASFVATMGCGPKNTAPVKPPTGWHQEEGWTLSCYFPPDWGALPELERRAMRATALDDMISQWNGSKEDGIAFKADRLEEVEIVLLGRPEKIEEIVTANLKQCETVATGSGEAAAWESWLTALPGKLTEGECLQPLDYTMFDYLDIGSGWQRPLSICEGDKVRVSGTLKDKYRAEDGGPWINVEGDPDRPTVGDTSLPCNLEGCNYGMLVLRFTSEEGVETILPVTGGSIVFTAPSHGTIDYRINDEKYFDNIWFKNGGIIDHTAIEISPAN